MQVEAARASRKKQPPRCEQDRLARPERFKLLLAHRLRPARASLLHQVSRRPGLLRADGGEHTEAAIPGRDNGRQRPPQAGQLAGGQVFRPETQRPRRAQQLLYRALSGALPEPVLQGSGINRHLVKLRYQRKAMQSAINYHPQSTSMSTNRVVAWPETDARAFAAPAEPAIHMESVSAVPRGQAQAGKMILSGRG